ncbi:MAG: hypothetical protein NZ959_07815 [Armatimonadetes bacterium]|nr:hypothetical protein [Armatimonadota bacterium]MDW8121691.1 sigma factor-like helix-turn-helix DNA-binding protein [Armatimonadota bacterium]
MTHFAPKSFKPFRKRLVPVLTPSAGGFDSLAVYNPAVFKDEGYLYMLYRARDKGGVHTGAIGFAESQNGLYWQRHPRPVLLPDSDQDRFGCEDPRVVKVGSEYFMTYTGVSRWTKGGDFRSHVLLAQSRDLKLWKKRPIQWINFPVHWRDLNAKAAALCPFKVEGQWLMFFTLVWDRWRSAIAYAVSSDGQHWSVPSDRFLLAPREGYFDSRVVEVGVVPFLQDDVIVLIYNGKDTSAWRVGLALLDQHEPQRVLYRTDKPLLEPSLTWETKGLTPQVTFVAGGLLSDADGWTLYYGAADTVIGMATDEPEPLCPPNPNLTRWVAQTVAYFLRRHRQPRSFSFSEWKAELDQTGWLAGLEALELYDESRGVPLELFVRQKVWNALKTLWRSENRQSCHTFSLEEMESGPLQESPGTERKALWSDDRSGEMPALSVREAIEHLPEKERFVIEKLFWEGQTLAAVARQLNVSTVWVYKLKEKALNWMRRYLKEAPEVD